MLASEHMQDLWDYLRAVCRHWLSVVAGAVLSAGMTVWAGYGGPALGGRATTGIVAIGVVVAMYRAWQDEHRLRVEAEAARTNALDARPRAEARVITDNGNLIVGVVNTGAQGDFTATVRAEYAGTKVARHTAKWGFSEDKDFFLASGSEGFVHIAERVSGSVDGKTHVLWRLLSEAGGYGNRASLSKRTPDSKGDEQAATITIELVSRPEMQQRREVMVLVLEGDEVVESSTGKRHTVTPRNVGSFGPVVIRG